MIILPSLVHDLIIPALGTLTTVAILIYNNRKLISQQKLMHAANQATHEAWVKKTDEKLTDHEERLEDHQGRFEDLSKEYAPRSEVQREIQSIQSGIEGLHKWLQTFLPIMLARVVPGGYLPMPEMPKPEEKK